jgi:Chondroitinase B
MLFVSLVCRKIRNVWVCGSVVVLVLVVANVLSAHALTDINVCSKPQLLAAVNTAQPGDRIRLCNGVWVDLKLVLSRSGSAEQPIVLTTQNPGGVTISGHSYIELAGSYIHISGFRWADYGDPSPKVGFIQTSSESHHCKISEMVFEEDIQSPKTEWIFNVALRGRGHEVFSSAFLEKRGLGAQLLVWQGGENLNHELHHLYFRRKPLGYEVNGEQLNGGESLQTGAGDGVELLADDLSAHHLFFDNASGESEIISVKGSRQVLSDIVMIGCQGALSLRMGNTNTIQRVYINGQNKHWAAGVLVLGDNHTIKDVFVTGISDKWTGGIQIPSGNPRLDQDAANKVVVDHVTVLDASDSITIGTEGIPPSNLLFDSVIVVQKVREDRVLFVYNAEGAFMFRNSFLHGESNVTYPSGAQNIDPVLVSASDGLSLPAQSGPAYRYGSRMTGFPVQRNQTGPQTFSYNVTATKKNKMTTPNGLRTVTQR